MKNFLQKKTSALHVLVIDEPWAHTPWLIQAFLDAGMQVEVAVRQEGRARCRTLGVPAHTLPDDEAAQGAAIAALLDDGARDHHPWDHVVPISDRLLLLCASLQHPATARTQPVADALLALFADRRPMLEFVAQLGIDIPAQLALPDSAHLAEAAQRFGWPLVLRGCQGSGGSQVRIEHDMAAARRALDALAGESSGEPFAQACVPGQIVIVGGIFRAGEPVRAVCSIPVERWPLPTSPSIVQRTFRDPALEEITRKLMSALNYNGLASLEMMRRPDGGYTFIELNPRSWGSIACAQQIGIDFPALYAHMLAGTLAPVADPFSVPEGVDLPLFPQYIKARLSNGGLLDALRHPRCWWRGWRPAPWRRPRLMLTLVRQLLIAWRKHWQKSAA